MKSKKEDSFIGWLGPAVILILGGIIIFGSPITQEALCRGTSNCLVTWVGALSGYFALAAAGIGVWITWGQLAEARRQTAFLLGEGIPTLSNVKSAGPGQHATFQLINWNKGIIAVYSATFTTVTPGAPDLPKPLGLIWKTLGPEDTPWHPVKLKEEQLETAAAVLGWIDRQRHPPGMWIEIVFAKGAWDDLPADDHAVYEFALEIFMDDNEGSRHIVPISCHVGLNQMSDIRAS